MLHTKFRRNRSLGSGEDFEGFYLIWTWRSSWSCNNNNNNIVFILRGLHIKYKMNLSKNMVLCKIK